MSSLVEKDKQLYELLRKIDRNCVAFCPVGLSDDEIIDFVNKNRDKKLQILEVYFTYLLTESYKDKDERRMVVEFLNFVCLTEKKVIDEGMTLFEALKIVNDHYHFFFTMLMYATYNDAKAVSEFVNFRIPPRPPHEILKLMAVEFSSEYIKDSAGEYLPEAASFFEKYKFKRPADWSTKQSQ
jgi:hypothetical protein